MCIPVQRRAIKPFIAVKAPLGGDALAAAFDCRRAALRHAIRSVFTGDYDPQRFPALAVFLASGVFDVADDPDDEFIFGLDRILDGVAALICGGG